MLDNFRHAAQSWPVKILFAILTLAFAGWGVGDMSRLRLDSVPGIKVGSHEISPADVVEEFRRDVDQIGAQFRGQFTIDQARQMGLLQRTIQQIVSRTLIDEAVAKLHITVDKQTLQAQIAAIPAFQSELHSFDKGTYFRALANARMTERQFLAMEQSDITRQQMVRAIGDGVTAPTSLVAPLDQARLQQRVLDTIRLPLDKIPAPTATPDEPSLKAILDAHADRFTTPETRSISAVLLRVEDLAAGIKPSDADIAKAYDARAAEFQTPEKRTIRQVVFADQDKASAFAAKLTAQTDFAAAAKAEGLTVVDLGTLARTGLPFAELADAAFTPAKPGLAGPVKSPLGWHVLDITAITPGSVQLLAAVRDQISAALAKDAATAQLYALSTKLEDSIGSGASIDEAAKTVGVAPQSWPAVDRLGHGGDGKPVAGVPQAPEFLTTAFETAAGSSSDIVSLRDGSGYFVVHVDKVTPAARQTVDMVRPALVALWTHDQQLKSAQEQADQIADRLRKGEPFSAVAGSWPTETTTPLRRVMPQDSKIPPELSTAAFKLSKIGDVAVVPEDGGPVVVRLKEIIPVDPKQESLDKPKQQISESLSADILQEYVAALQKDYGVRVNQALIDQQFQK